MHCLTCVWSDLPELLLMAATASSALTPNLAKETSPSDEDSRFIILRQLFTLLVALPAPRVSERWNLLDEKREMRGLALW